MVSISRKTWIKAGALIALVLALAVVLVLRHYVASGRAQKTPALAGAQQSSSAAVASRSPSADGFVGVVLARQSVQVAPKMEGPLAAVNVRIGDRVALGAVVASLDTALLKKELAVAQAVVLSAKSDQERSRAELAQAQVKLESTQRIEKYVSASELKTIESEHQAAVSKLESAKAVVLEKQARVKQLQETLANAEIRAPFDGVVAVRYADTGAMVSTLKPVIRLVSDDRLLRFAVPEEERSVVQRGTAVIALIDSQNERVPAVVETVAPEVDPVSGTIIVEAALKDPDHWKERLPSGSVARVFVDAGKG
jgi:RND family efflux transporter MFP subunit